MDFFQVIQKRKAVRRYLPDQSIPQKDISKILEAINLAPSAKHLQSFRVFIVQARKNIEKIYQSCYSQRTDFVRNAALILIFCTDPGASIATFGKRGKMYSLQDATIAAAFSLLAATALGYATCWVGNFKEVEMKQILKTGLTPVAAIIIGIGDEDPERPGRKPLNILSSTV